MTQGLSYTFILVDDMKENNDLRNLAETFRVEAAKLVEMLDISIPVVGKLKVSRYIFSTTVSCKQCTPLLEIFSTYFLQLQCCYFSLSNLNQQQVLFENFRKCFDAWLWLSG